MTNVLVVAETRAGEIRKVALEAVTAARALADAAGGEVHAMAFGPPGLAGSLAPLAEHGADAVLACEDIAFAKYDPESMSATVASKTAAGAYRVVLLSASAQGKDLAPRVAAKLGVPLAADVTTVDLVGDSLRVKHPTYTGKLLAALTLAGSPAVVSLRPSAVVAVPKPRAMRSEVLSPTADPASSRVKVTETISGGATQLDLAEAPVVIAGGRGLKAAENFKLLEALAAAFGNAAVGATRAVTDDGWRPHHDQIGQTGRLVSPDLYIAVGISGAIQHLAGMRTSKTIVAINQDPDAPIFKVADYGIVGDSLQIVPVLTAAVREARGTAR